MVVDIDTTGGTNKAKKINIYFINATHLTHFGW